MPRFAAGVVSLVCSGAPLLAQTPPPGPAAETAAVFTAAEAYAFACCQRIAAAWRQGDAADLRDWAPLPGYCGMSAARSADGLMQLDDKTLLSQARMQLASRRSMMPAGGEVLWYLVPEQAGETGNRVFCVRGDGVVAYSDNSAGTAMDGGRSPEPLDALGDGGNDELGAFPRTPGRGRDGNMWMPGELVKQTTARVMLVDESGAPHAAMVIAALPADSPAETIDIAFPAGVGRTLREGDATWTGVPANGLALEVRVQGIKLRLAKSAVTATGSTLRAVVERSEVARLRWGANESAAIATLKNISSAQCQCQASGVIDVNKNGAGEFGTFAELTGRDPVRGGKAPIAPPVLSTALGKVEDGVVVRSGYCFRMFLPGKDGAAVAELDKGGPDAAAIDAARAEVVWCLYAWPVAPGKSGQRVFFVDQGGCVLAASNDDNRYAGVAKMPPANAARAAGSDGKLSAPTAANVQGLDGQHWRVVN
jgi:hypothetical protein